MHTLMNTVLGHPISISTGLFFTFGILHVLRRLYLHPLSSFPGPRMGAVTSLYKTYYEVIKGGEMLEQIRYLHTIYGESMKSVYLTQAKVVLITLNRASYSNWTQ